MSHTIIFKKDYGHFLQVEVDELNDITGALYPTDVSPYTTKLIIGKKPDDSIVYMIATASGLCYLSTTIPSGFFSITGYYQFNVLLENDLQRFHSTEFGFDVTIPKEE